MTKHVLVEIVRVFSDEHAEFGNPLGIVNDLEQHLSSAERQRIATTLGFSETVFINSLAQPDISIFDTIHPVKFAGHAVVGAAWYLTSLESGHQIDKIGCGDLDIRVWREESVQWIEAPMSVTPPWNHEQLASPDLVDAITPEEAATKQHVFTWAWQDEDRGLVRARTFLPDWDILEDQGNGSGSMQRAVSLNRDLVISHGLGSIIYVRVGQEGFGQLGGRVTGDGSRTIDLV